MTQKQKLVVRHGGFQRMIVLIAPARQQAVDGDGIDHRTRHDMRADFAALFQHHHGKVRVDLLQADRGRQPGGAGADDHHVEFHAFAFDVVHCEILELLLQCAGGDSRSGHAAKTRLFDEFMMAQFGAISL